jgi:DNA-directed RNA polymerase subunit RPC12/RpoP
MVWDFFKKLFSKSDDQEYVEDEVPQEEIQAIIDRKQEKRVEEAKEKAEVKSQGNRIAADTNFTRYICAKCFRTSEFKKGTVPAACPHCHCSDKTKFKPQRGQ